MNKYEVLFDEIFKQTKTQALHWKQVRRAMNSDLILNPSMVFRQYAADFVRGGNTFKLFLIEKKYDDPEHDFAYERYVPEILVLDDDGELITTLTDSVIEPADLMRLVDLVRTRSDKASKLFDSAA